MSSLKRQAPHQRNQDQDSICAAVAAAAFAIHSLEENGSGKVDTTINLPQSTSQLSFKKVESLDEVSMRQLTMKNHEGPDRGYSTLKPSRSSSNKFTFSESDAPVKAGRNGKLKSVLSWANEKMSKTKSKFGSRKE